MAEPTPKRKMALNLVVLLLLIAVTAIRFVPWTLSSEDMTEEEASLLLDGLEPDPEVDETQVVQRDTRRIPGRSVIGDRAHEELESTVEALDDRMSELELAGLVEPDTPETPEDEPDTRAQPDIPHDEDPARIAEDDTSETEPAEIVAADEAEPEPDTPEVADTPVTPPEPDPPPRQGSGIWVREQRQGANPIQIEDHASVNATQLSEMARVRNLSTDPQYPPPNFNIGAVGSGRMGVYVIADGNMVRQDGQIPAKDSPPNAWRLVDASQREVLWAPVN